MTYNCAQTGTVCNCDKKDDVWRSDGGRATEKHRLPVTEVRIGDTGNFNERKIYSIGPLICHSGV